MNKTFDQLTYGDYVYLIDLGEIFQGQLFKDNIQNMFTVRWQDGLVTIHMDFKTEEYKGKTVYGCMSTNKKELMSVLIYYIKQNNLKIRRGSC